MALKAALTVGGLATTAVATVSIAYVATSGSQGGKTKVWFDSDGLCNYKTPSVFSTGRINASDAASEDNNVCLKLANNKMSWDEVEITWDHYEEYKKKNKDDLKEKYDSWKKSQSGSN